MTELAATTPRGEPAARRAAEAERKYAELLESLRQLRSKCPKSTATKKLVGQPPLFIAEACEDEDEDEHEDEVEDEDEEQPDSKEDTAAKRHKPDIVQELGRTRALDHLLMYLTEHKGDAPNDPEAPRPKGKPVKAAAEEGIPKWYLNTDIGCWQLTSDLNSTGYGVWRIYLKNDRISKLAQKKAGKRVPNNLLPRSKVGGVRRSSRPNEAAVQVRSWLAHLISYYAYYGKGINKNSASHLCGNCNCFNPEHIVDETRR